MNKNYIKPEVDDTMFQAILAYNRQIILWGEDEKGRWIVWVEN